MAATRPLIGCTTYRKTAQAPRVDVYGLMPAYIEAIRAAGGIPILIPLGMDEAELDVVFERIDGLLLPGGGDIAPHAYNGRMDPTVNSIDEDRDRVEFYLARRAVAEKKATLAICRGHQVLNVALGGTLWEDVHTRMPGGMKHDFDHLKRRNRPHEVQIEAGSRLARLLGRTQSPVNSMHHQGVRDLAPGLVCAAVAPDGLVESYEAVDHPFAVGVQWHPENLVHDDPAMRGLFSAFVGAAAPAVNGYRR